MKRSLIALVALGLFAVGCEQTEPTMPDSLGLMPQANTGPVLSRAYVGSPDAFGPGGDANFSLIALAKADGSVTGQYHDQFAGGVGVHIAVDCLTIVGNEAWVSGVITNSRLEFLLGRAAATRVADNGRSANDPADQISFTFIGGGFGLPDDFTCGDTPDFPLQDVSEGQVVVVSS
ncbi:MAG: hypothetical protein JSU87_15925 [Gemmatimonadota bacterium]|nr:MAG: hypothetical protein JSU87_15925 [Gemmatimonadota bacterium]